MNRKKISVILLSLVLLLSSFTGIQLNAHAEGGKETERRVISIVYDNSGSMYYDGHTGIPRWCQAIYAMEVFAAMLNDGDVLKIYPMHPIETNGQEYTGNKPLIIEGGKNQAGLIQDILTPYAAGTPIETISYAYDGIKNEDGEKWLIVLTDGANFYRNNSDLGDKTKGELEAVLTEMSYDVNVLYLGIDVPSSVAPAINGSMEYTKTPESKDVPETLSKMCNMIFGRDELSADRIANNKIDISDLSMNKIIVFAQGESISSLEVKDASGNTLSPDSTYKPHFSTKGASTASHYHGSDFDILKITDPTLMGVMLTFTDVPKGTYEYSAAGASSVRVYYEPKVTLSVNIKHKGGEFDGQSLKGADEIYEGDYVLTYALVDEDGATVTSDLVGNTDYKVSYELNGNTIEDTSDKPGEIPISLKDGDSFKVNAVDVYYLSGYHLHKEGKDLGLKEGGYNIRKPIGELILTCSDGPQEIAINELDEKAVYELQVSYSGELLKGNDLASVMISATPSSSEMNLRPDFSHENGFIILRFKYNGSAEETNLGPQLYEVKASYVNEHNETVESNICEIRFELTDYVSPVHMEIAGLKDYYTTGEFGNEDEFEVKFDIDGKPLTKEELDSVVLDFESDMEGVEYETTPDYEHSSMKVSLKGHEKVKAKKDKYKINVKAQVTPTNEKAVNLEKTEKVGIGLLPKWAIYGLIGLGILLFALLVFLFLRMKVLPVDLLYDSQTTAFTIKNRACPGSSKRSYSASKKLFARRATFTLSSPPAPAFDVTATLGFSITMEAETSLFTRIFNRRGVKFKVTQVKPRGTNVSEITISGRSLEKDDFSKTIANPIIVSYHGAFEVDGKSGKGSRLNLSGNFKFR